MTHLCTHPAGLQAFRFDFLNWQARIPAWIKTILLFLCLASLSSAAPPSLEEETQRLLAGLPDASEAETLATIRRLSEIGPEARAALPALAGFVDQDKYQIAAADALTSLGGEAIDTLRDSLRRGHDPARIGMLWAISKMRHDAKPLIPDIVEMTHDQNARVRRNAVVALGRLRMLPAITTPAMVAMLESKDQFDAAYAADALTEMGPAADSAIPALEKAAIQHADPYVRCRAMLALAAVDRNDEATVRALTHGLRDKGSYDSPFALSVAQLAAENLALRASNASPAAPVLLEVLKTGPLRRDLSWYAAISFTLASLDAQDAVPVLQSDLTYDQESDADRFPFFSDRIIPESYDSTCIRTCAAAALARLHKGQHKQMIAQLQETMEDETWSVVAPAGSNGAQLMDPRAVAATGLGLLDDQASAALPALQRTMDKGLDESSDLAVRAAWAIARIDANDRSCVKGLLSDDSALSLPRGTSMNWNSPFYRESPEEVARILGTRMDVAMPAIVNAALISNSEVRAYHIDVLRQVGPAGIQALVDAMFQVIGSPDGKWPQAGGLFECAYRADAYRVADCLGQHAEPAMNTLIRFLESNKHLVRAEAAHMLGVIGREPAKVVPPLRRLLKDDRVLVRARAAEAMGRFGGDATEAVAELQQLADDEYAWVRDAAAKALMHIRSGPTQGGVR